MPFLCFLAYFLPVWWSPPGPGSMTPQKVYSSVNSSAPAGVTLKAAGVGVPLIWCALASAVALPWTQDHKVGRPQH